MTGLRAVDVIARKRDGGEVDSRALRWLVDGYLAGDVSDGQMAAFLMAGVLRGFTDREAITLTQVLLSSGETLDLGGLRGPTVDKHSTGGVGDGTTLLVAPLLAAAGAQLVKLAGRGLGHTGGTLDKLESIPGFRVALEPDEMRRIVEDVGCVVAAQTARLVPADKALYALRDVTGTVASTALIASSVMSKKLASGASTIVLDVKVGDGAFMRDLDQAVGLARLCVRIGNDAGRSTAALVTDMETPLGRGIGNALEVAEAVRLLRSRPAGRLAAVALELSVTGLSLARGGEDETAVRKELIGLWESGAALERLRRMVAAQGGDPRVCDDPVRVLPKAPVGRTVTASSGGTVARLPARAVGELAAALGAGRAHKDDEVDPAVGIELLVDVGDRVEASTELAIVHARTPTAADEAAVALGRLFTIGADEVPPPPTVHRRFPPG
jgi:pyrimidine-nucleoside phosphorylase